jgi:hypothetical protein
MHHWLRGALGAAVVYPLVWYYSAPGAAPTAGKPGLSGEKPVARAVAPAAAPAPASPLTYEPEAPERRVASPIVTERLPVPTRVAPAAEPELPRLPTVEDPNVPLAGMPEELTAVMPELKDVMARAADVQQHAHDPGALEQRVQTLDEDPAKLAKLKALADMFVQLPTPRSESYLPSSSGTPSTGR